MTSIKITTDYNMIRDMLINDKELFERITDDFSNVETWEPDKSIWIGYFNGNKCLGLLSVEEENAIVLNIHIHIPKKNRGKNSFKIGNDLLKYLIDNRDKRFVKINAKIPVIYKDVIRYAEKGGFEVEGIDRMSFQKNGKIHDRAIMGRVIG